MSKGNEKYENYKKKKRMGTCRSLYRFTLGDILANLFEIAEVIGVMYLQYMPVRILPDLSCPEQPALVKLLHYALYPYRRFNITSLPDMMNRVTVIDGQPDPPRAHFTDAAASADRSDRC